MKKVLLVLVLFAFISVMPSFSMKVILNDQSDRLVPSRCSGMLGYDDSDLNYDESQNNVKNRIKKKDPYSYTLSKYIRTELVGTKWGYYQEEDIQPAVNVQKSARDEKLKLLKRGSREAADYYMQDTLNNPDNLVQSGFMQTSEIKY